MFKRFLETILAAALDSFPGVLLAGARQVGKSTLCMGKMPNYVTLDDTVLRAAAQTDPVTTLAHLPRPICLDEIQKAPELIEAIKMEIDRDRKKGQFLLTGSASVLDMKQVGDTLAGRIVILNAWPLTLKEKNNSLENVIEKLLNHDLTLSSNQSNLNEALAFVISGGFPESVALEDTAMRHLWFSTYIATYIERDVRDLAEIKNIMNFIKLFNLLGPRSANILNIKELSRDAALSEATVLNYITLLELVFQVKRVPSYSGNISSRWIKSPKLYFCDSGVLCHLLGIREVSQLQQSAQKGLIMETFICAELWKHIAYAQRHVQLYHYRTADQREIDFILSYQDQLIAIEVKASHQVSKACFKHIIDFMNKNDQVSLGIVFYWGTQILPFGEKLFAVPITFFG